ncbi:CopG family transcriptional regulator [Calidifontibacter sp. DB0510]|uniref:CopG family transcriptional regulator n=1 Tax=Metallococcus carri TaxID=1656884 RepID=A0A967AXI4_9MICO|nr:CopG family transcriptional regulator [Metallococcus carri]NHN54262.1 CopG family transcriptional regulator [Metallococcus carri]NOP36898.1 CopG family transcriptional regulator [Calidifontibacter sp. DB2511S]
MAMTLRLTEQQTRLLRETAERDGTSMHALAVRAIDAYLAPRTAVRDRLLGQILAEDAAVLERLRDA